MKTRTPIGAAGFAVALTLCLPAAAQEASRSGGAPAGVPKPKRLEGRLRPETPQRTPKLKHRRPDLRRAVPETPGPLDRARRRRALRWTKPQLYADQSRRQVRSVLPSSWGAKPLTDGIREVLRQSARRRAWLDRIEDLAIEASDAATIERVERLRRLEPTRVGRALLAATTTSQEDDK